VGKRKVKTRPDGKQGRYVKQVPGEHREVGRPGACRGLAQVSASSVDRSGNDGEVSGSSKSCRYLPSSVRA